MKEEKQNTLIVNIFAGMDTALFADRFNSFFPILSLFLLLFVCFNDIKCKYYSHKRRNCSYR